VHEYEAPHERELLMHHHLMSSLGARPGEPVERGRHLLLIQNGTFAAAEPRSVSCLSACSGCSGCSGAGGLAKGCF